MGSLLEQGYFLKAYSGFCLGDVEGWSKFKLLLAKQTFSHVKNTVDRLNRDKYKQLFAETRLLSDSVFGTKRSVLNTEVSLFQGCPFNREGFHCVLYHG